MRKSSNPFMITSNQDYGIQIEQLKSSRLVKSLNATSYELMQKKEQENESNLSFLYTRESDKIGADIKTSRSALSKAFDKEKLPKYEKIKTDNMTPPNNQSRCSIISAEEVIKTLDNYSHNPKIENPLYTTTSNEFGSKKPSHQTLSKMSYSRSQRFSKSFNRIMFQDQGLNTSLTRSCVHDRLDTT